MKTLTKKIRKINIFILAILFLLSFTLLYFLYFRARNQAEVYVGLSVAYGINIPVNTVYNYNLIPNWMDDAISKGDKEVSPLGGVSATVLDKESYEASFYGKYVYLLLKVKAIKDRSGIYLFKNKPLSTGALIDLKLTKAQIIGLVTYVGREKPKYQFKKLLVKLVGLGVDYWVADAVKIGSAIINNNGEEIAKVLDKKITPVSSIGVVSADQSNNRSLITFDRNKRDVEIIVELLVGKSDDNYFYAETQKVKIGENIFLPFKEVSVNLLISSVSEINETK